MKIIKRIFPILILLSLLIGILSGCLFDKYHAKLYIFGYGGTARENVWLDSDFSQNNKVYGAYYRDDEDAYESEKDTISPRSRTFIIKDQEAYNEIFLEGAIDIDFETEMIVLYTQSVSDTDPFEIGDISIDENGVLNIQLIELCAHIPNTHLPGQEYYAIKMQKQDISEANFIFAEKTVSREYAHEKHLEQLEIYNERKEEYDSLNSNNSK